MALNNVESQAQAVWAATTLEAKQDAFKVMLGLSKITAEKKEQYLRQLPSWNTKKIDQTATNFMLFDKDPVIK